MNFGLILTLTFTLLTAQTLTSVFVSQAIAQDSPNLLQQNQNDPTIKTSNEFQNLGKKEIEKTPTPKLAPMIPTDNELADMVEETESPKTAPKTEIKREPAAKTSKKKERKPSREEKQKKKDKKESKKKPIEREPQQVKPPKVEVKQPQVDDSEPPPGDPDPEAASKPISKKLEKKGISLKEPKDDSDDLHSFRVYRKTMRKLEKCEKEFASTRQADQKRVKKSECKAISDKIEACEHCGGFAVLYYEENQKRKPAGKSDEEDDKMSQFEEVTSRPEKEAKRVFTQ